MCGVPVATLWKASVIGNRVQAESHLVVASASTLMELARLKSTIRACGVRSFIR